MGDDRRVWRENERTERHDALEALTTSVRRLVEHSVRTGHDAERLRAIAAEVDAVADQLAEVADDDPWSARCYGSILVDPTAFMGINPGMGRMNPVAPIVRTEVREGEVDGTVRFDLQHVGPPYRAHGGVVAAVFDQVLGTAAIAGRKAGMTESMTVRYTRATPLEEDVRFVARFTGAADGISHTTGEMYDSEGRVTAEAEATFYLPKDNA